MFASPSYRLFGVGVCAGRADAGQRFVSCNRANRRRRAVNQQSCRERNLKFPRRVALITLAAMLLPATLDWVAARPPSAEEFWNLTSGNVRVRCRLTVGGSFDAVTSAISGTLRRTGSEASYAGALQVDLVPLDTGIELRNNHLRETYLEVARGERFRHAALTGIELAVPLPPDAARHKTPFSGTLSLHGVERAIKGEAELSRHDGRLRVEAAFSLSLKGFDIPPPRYLGVGVRDEVGILVIFDAVSDTSPSGDSR